MHISFRSNAVAAAAAMMMLTAAASTASANCTRLGFSVNDYGKDGPTNDAKSLLDKYIAKWAADHGLKTYTASKKDVSCELYLDVGLFDEHTCKASANVCWKGSAPRADAAAAQAKAQRATAAKATPAATKPKT